MLINLLCGVQKPRHVVLQRFSSPTPHNYRRHITHPAPTSVFDGEPRVGPWVKDAWFGKVVPRELLHPLKRGEVFLTAPPERTPPEVLNALAENPQRRIVRRHREVVEEAVQGLSARGDHDRRHRADSPHS
jgi:hypothetical protein